MGDSLGTRLGAASFCFIDNSYQYVQGFSFQTQQSTPQTEALVLNEFVIKVFRTFVNILVSNYVMCDCVNECAFEHTAHR